MLEWTRQNCAQFIYLRKQCSHSSRMHRYTQLHMTSNEQLSEDSAFPVGKHLIVSSDRELSTTDMGFSVWCDSLLEKCPHCLLMFHKGYFILCEHLTVLKSANVQHVSITIYCRHHHWMPFLWFLYINSYLQQKHWFNWTLCYKHYHSCYQYCQHLSLPMAC